MRLLVWIGLAAWLTACRSTEPKPIDATRVATPWELQGRSIAEQEMHALCTLRYGCSGCTRFVSNELIVQRDGSFRVIDLGERAERHRGTASAAQVDALRTLLASEAWKMLPDGETDIQSERPWLEVRGGGRRLRRVANGRAAEPPLDRILQLLDAIVSP